jgi:hypothetical protein
MARTRHRGSRGRGGGSSSWDGESAGTSGVNGTGTGSLNSDLPRTSAGMEGEADPPTLTRELSSASGRGSNDETMASLREQLTDANARAAALLAKAQEQNMSYGEIIRINQAKKGIQSYDGTGEASIESFFMLVEGLRGQFPTISDSELIAASKEKLKGKVAVYIAGKPELRFLTDYDRFREIIVCRFGHGNVQVASADFHSATQLASEDVQTFSSRLEHLAGIVYTIPTSASIEEQKVLLQQKDAEMLKIFLLGVNCQIQDSLLATNPQTYTDALSRAISLQLLKSSRNKRAIANEIMAYVQGKVTIGEGIDSMQKAVNEMVKAPINLKAGGQQVDSVFNKLNPTGKEAVAFIPEIIQRLEKTQNEVHALRTRALKAANSQGLRVDTVQFQEGKDKQGCYYCYKFGHAYSEYRKRGADEKANGGIPSTKADFFNARKAYNKKFGNPGGRGGGNSNGNFNNGRGGNNGNFRGRGNGGRGGRNFRNRGGGRGNNNQFNVNTIELGDQSQNFNLSKN